MFKTIALIGLAAVLALPSASAFAVSGNSSSFGSQGYGPTVPTQSLTPFQRSLQHDLVIRSIDPGLACALQ